MSPGRARKGASVALVSLAVAGCGAEVFEGGVFKNSELSFRVTNIPAEWRRLDESGALLAFRDDSAPASIEVNGRCGKDGDDVPLESLTHHLFLQFSDRVIESENKIEMDGREALHTELLAKLDGVQKRFVVFVLKKNGCVYDFVQVAPPTANADGRRRFIAFVQGFSTIAP